MKISDIRIGGQVTTETGRIGQVTSAHEDGAVYVRFGSDYPEPARASDLEHFAPDACESCKQIVDSYQEGRRDEYREQREKIEAARLKAVWDGKPLAEVAKIYIQISPAVLAHIISGKEE
jgi:hypothetical protein